jgi:cation diffusion facilitator CzcD-associated flavoprotein CzcO
MRAAAMIKEQVETIVIGAGWAGLGVSYALAKAGLAHRVLERGRIGETGVPNAGTPSI